MARNRRRSSDRPDDTPKTRKRSRPTRYRTDLSAFLSVPLAVIDDAAFEALRRQMHDLLAPSDEIEEDLAGQILLAFEQVRRGLQAMARGTPGADRYLKTVLASFRTCQKSYDLLRELLDGRRTPETATAPPAAPALPPEPAPAPLPEPDPEPEPEPAPPEQIDEVEADPEVEEVEPAAFDWRSRIAMVPARDARWPVLDQLDLIVDDVLSLRDRGTSEEELLDRFPSLTDADLAACYACEADGYRGPLEPPYPEDIAVLEYGPE